MVFLSEIIKSPYAGSTILAIGILISVLAGFSGTRKINLSISVLNAITYAGCIYIYIRNYLVMGAQSNFLVSLGLPEIMLSCIMIFSGLNALFFICMHRLSSRSLVRFIILLTFFIIAVLFMIMADNVVMFTVSVMLTILSIYYLLASLEKKNIVSREYISGFGFRITIPAALILFGFSLLAGTGRIRMLSAYSGMEKPWDPMVLISVIVFASAVYLYAFLYPLQSVFLKLSRRVKAAPATALWFLYIPAGLVLFLKLDVFFNSYTGTENLYGFLILTALAFISLFGAGLGQIRSKSIKRILSMFILFQLGTLVFIRAAGFAGTGNPFEPSQYSLMTIIIILASFLPLSLLSMIIEETGTDDSIDGMKGLIYRNPFAGICFILTMLWWLAANAYVFLINGPTGIAVIYSYGIKEIILITGFTLALLLILANIIKIIIVFSRRSAPGAASIKLSLPGIFYVYLSFFILLMLASLVLIISGKTGINPDHISIWGKTINIFSSGN